MTSINIDGRDFPANPQENLLQVCLSRGFDLPYFCWHPALGSVGACRQCAVKQFAGPDDASGRIVMACMTPAAEGTRISIADPEAAAFRASVIEWLMTNHPHDCPVCEEGGECHLQDMTVMTGHTHRRYRFSKRTHRNQYLGPFIKHEMNRCIACYRCVRFYRDYAGGHDLDVHAAHNNVYFGRDEDGVLESEFSGNLVEVCPTGVFTDRTLSAAYNRKWDMRSAPSLCVHCGLGCNTLVSERGGQVRRILNRYNGEVNGYFLCDRGRFGYGFANRPDRVRRPLLGERGTIRPATKAEALERLGALLGGGARLIGIGSPRASLEANFALRTLVGADAFFAGIAEPEARCLAVIAEGLRSGPVRTPSLREAEAADAVLVLGEDVASTAPRLALSLRQAMGRRSASLSERLKIAQWRDAALRQAAQDIRAPFFIATPEATRLDGIASAWRAAPDDIARLGFAILHRIDPAAPAVEGLAEETQALAARIAEALLAAKRPLIVSGCQMGSEALPRAALDLARALRTAERDPGIVFAVPECDSMGLALMQGGGIQDAFAAARQAEGPAPVVIVLENDLYRRARLAAVEALFHSAASVVALDHVPTETGRKADVFLPCADFAGCEGTMVSGEGRAQRFFPVVFPKDEVQPGWMWLRDAARAAGLDGGAGWETLDDVTHALASALPVFSGIVGAAPGRNFRIEGSRIRTEPHRYSGRTAVDANRAIHEPRASLPEESPFSATMEGYYGRMPAALMPFFWAPGWNSAQSLNKFQDEVGGHLRGGDAGVRLIEPQADAASRPYGRAPQAFSREPGGWLVVPHQHMFGSEELSALAPPVAERADPPALRLNAADAR
ncbi:MAG TPA: NADH-quinone oxidoreductase subunit NuoG, partial [Acetobacteraceae bacterium]|nr:NADH-quinone oxidoreductase subunit NuoG [Acetobacteraceae bacterium]